MYAIVEIAGKQFKVQENTTLYVPRLQADPDSTVTFDRVLLVSGTDGVTVGTPTVSGHAITATVLEHVKGDKVLVFKKKRRKRYKVTRGHRQPYTKIRVTSLNGNGSAENEA